MGRAAAAAAVAWVLYRLGLVEWRIGERGRRKEGRECGAAVVHLFAADLLALPLPLSASFSGAELAKSYGARWTVVWVDSGDSC